MTAPDLDEFGRRVRGLDPETLTRFVADLYAARGFETTVTGGDRFVATRPRDGDEETLTVRVARSLPSDPASEHVVVARRADVGSVGDTEVIDVRSLHRMALYAVDRERLRALSAEYFDEDWSGGRREDGNGAGRRVFGWVGSAGPSMETLANPPTALLAVLLAVSVVIVLAAATGGSGGPTTEPGIDRTVTPVPVSTQQQGTSTDALGPAQADVCPAPPADVHPASFRPVPVDAALSTGLESWEVQLRVNVSTFFAPTELQIRWMPERRHESTYRTPEGEDIVLTIDQWNSSVAAEKASRALAVEYGMAVAWGQYTFAVTYNSAPANTSVERQTARATSLLLLSEVSTPEGVKLGRECLETLLVERTA